VLAIFASIGSTGGSMGNVPAFSGGTTGLILARIPEQELTS
jgi:hypothetical protein